MQMSQPDLYVDPLSGGVTIQAHDPSVSLLWDQAVQASVIAEAPGPTIASRAYAVVHTAIFEAWAAYDLIAIGTAYGDSMQQSPEAISEANKAEAMSYAAYVAAVDLFPSQTAIFDALMERLGYSIDLAAVTDAAALGVQLGQGVIATFAGDGANQSEGYSDTTGYMPVNESPEAQVSIENWTPEHVPIDSDASLQSFLTPQWGWVDPFATETTLLSPPPPEPFFVDTIDAVLNQSAGTITLHGLSDDASWKDYYDLRAALHGVYRGTETWNEIREFLRAEYIEMKLAGGGGGGMHHQHRKGMHHTAMQEDGQTNSVVLDVSKALIGPIINQDFISQAEEVVAASAALSDEEKAIAEFWEDGGGTSFPPGTWMTFGQYVSVRDDHTLDEDAQMFFALANAVFDAGVATWQAKVEYDYARPVAVVRDLGELGLIGEWGVDFMGNEGWVIEAYAGDGLGTQTILAENFVTYQNPGSHPSPPFAEYVSGHSTFSAAAAEVLALFTGSQDFGAFVEIDTFQFETAPPEGPVVLEWETFEDAADEAGLSRIFGGIHFEDGDLNGRDLGTEVGTNVYQTAQLYIDGTADDFFFA
jgi:Domain of unknown function (DUF6851)/VCPO second helical-bundle domain